MQIRKRHHRRTFPSFRQDVRSPHHDVHRYGVFVPRSFSILG